MPTYDFRCNNCGQDVSLFYKTYKAYDNASPTCSNCHSADLTRVITSVAIGKGTSNHDFTSMDANQMLNVFESGDSRAVGEMMRQVGESAGGTSLPESYYNAADELRGGKSMDRVEKDLSKGKLGSTEPPTKPASTPKPPAE